MADKAVTRSAPSRIRTCDTRFRKPLLYPLSYGGGPAHGGAALSDEGSRSGARPAPASQSRRTACPPTSSCWTSRPAPTTPSRSSPPYSTPRSASTGSAYVAGNAGRQIVETETAETLVCLAPQTNVAMLLTQHPEVADHLQRILHGRL